MKKKFIERACAPKTGTTDTVEVPKPVYRMFKALLEANAFVENKSEIEVFNDWVMRESERSLGEREANRLMQVFEREERARQSLIHKEKPPDTPTTN